MSLMLDALEPITKLSKLFQADLLNVSTVGPMIKSTVAVLQEMKSSNGSNLSAAYRAIQDGKYKTINIKDNHILRISFQKDAEAFLERLIENIENRFESKSMGVLEHMDILLNPDRMDTTQKGIESHGQDAFAALIDFYGKEKKWQDLDEDGHVVDKVAPAVIDPKRAEKDYKQFKYLVKSLKGKSLVEICSIICEPSMANLFPDLATLASLVLVSPISSVPCERAFSCQNRIKTRDRATLSEKTLEMLMRIRLEGPDIEDFNFERACKLFCLVKHRSKVNK